MQRNALIPDIAVGGVVGVVPRRPVDAPLTCILATIRHGPPSVARLWPPASRCGVANIHSRNISTGTRLMQLWFAGMDDSCSTHFGCQLLYVSVPVTALRVHLLTPASPSLLAGFRLAVHTAFIS